MAAKQTKQKICKEKFIFLLSFSGSLLQKKVNKSLLANSKI